MAVTYAMFREWVRVDLTKADAAELRRIVEDAWRRTAPKKLIREHDSAG